MEMRSNTMPTPDEEFWGEPLFSYSRRDALEDGVLVDVTELGREAGFRLPLAVTREMWDSLVVPDELARQMGQSEQGRIWDILQVLRITIQQADSQQQICFSVSFAVQGREPVTFTLKAVCGPDDDNIPCITLMLPHEN